MEIIFTKHAKIRLFQREISEEQISSLIENPDIVNTNFKERVVARKNFNRGTLEAVYKKELPKIIVITCYWVKEA